MFQIELVFHPHFLNLLCQVARDFAVNPTSTKPLPHFPIAIVIIAKQIESWKKLTRIDLNSHKTTAELPQESVCLSVRQPVRVVSPDNSAKQNPNQKVKISATTKLVLPIKPLKKTYWLLASRIDWRLTVTAPTRHAT